MTYVWAVLAGLGVFALLSIAGGAYNLTVQLRRLADALAALDSDIGFVVRDERERRIRG